MIFTKKVSLVGFKKFTGWYNKVFWFYTKSIISRLKSINVCHKNIIVWYKKLCFGKKMYHMLIQKVSIICKNSINSWFKM